MEPLLISVANAGVVLVMDSVCVQNASTQFLGMLLCVQTLVNPKQPDRDMPLTSSTQEVWEHDFKNLVDIACCRLTMLLTSSTEEARKQVSKHFADIPG